MNVMRTIGKAGLALLALLMVLGICIGAKEGNWWGVFLCAGFLVLLAAFYDVFRVEALREKHPKGSFAPSRKVQGLLLLVLGLGPILGGLARLWTGSYVAGSGFLLVGVFLFFGGINVLRGRT